MMRLVEHPTADQSYLQSCQEGQRLIRVDDILPAGSHVYMPPDLVRLSKQLHSSTACFVDSLLVMTPHLTLHSRSHISRTLASSTMYYAALSTMYSVALSTMYYVALCIMYILASSH